MEIFSLLKLKNFQENSAKGQSNYICLDRERKINQTKTFIWYFCVFHFNSIKFTWCFLSINIELNKWWESRKMGKVGKCFSISKWFYNFCCIFFSEIKGKLKLSKSFECFVVIFLQFNGKPSLFFRNKVCEEYEFV